MIEYKTFEPLAWDDISYDELQEYFEPEGSGTYQEASLKTLEFTYDCCYGDDLDSDDNDRGVFTQKLIKNILKECPNLPPDEEFLFLIWW